MKQKATVVSDEGKYAKVRVDRSSMCDDCHKEGCSDGCALYRMFGAKTEFEAYAVNKAKAAKGDLVYVETADKNVNISALIVFLIPIVLAVLVYFIFSFLKEESVRILCAVASFVVYFAVLAIAERFRKNKTPKLSVTEIIDTAP